MGFMRKKESEERMGEKLEEREFKKVSIIRHLRMHLKMKHNRIVLYRRTNTPHPFIDKAAKIPSVPKWRKYGE